MNKYEIGIVKKKNPLKQVTKLTLFIYILSLQSIIL